MLFTSLSLAASLLVLPSVFAAPNSNAGAIVQLRIEGEQKTIFEGPVFTRGHDVETVSGGKHHCDGTNLNANPTPGPTCTSALDTAAHDHSFTWDGTFSENFDDYFITTIDGQAQTSTQFWGILLNYQFTPVGGCQQRVKLLDEVLWAFDAFNKAHFLKLTGSKLAHVNQAVTLTVVDGATGSPVAGAAVEGHTSDADGHVSVTFDSVGVKGVKAEKADSIRSNSLKIVIIP